MFNELNKPIENEDLPFVRVKDIESTHAVFTIESVNLKEGVKTNYGIQDAAYCKIHICSGKIPALDANNEETVVSDGQDCMVSIKQKALLSTIRAAIDGGFDLSGSRAMIKTETGKRATYYTFADA